MKALTYESALRAYAWIFKLAEVSKAENTHSHLQKP